MTYQKRRCHKNFDTKIFKNFLQTTQGHKIRQLLFLSLENKNNGKYFYLNLIEIKFTVLNYKTEHKLKHNT